MPGRPATAPIAIPLDVLRLLADVAAHVSAGRGAADITPYPDAKARRALGALDDAGLRPLLTDPADISDWWPTPPAPRTPETPMTHQRPHDVHHTAQPPTTEPLPPYSGINTHCPKCGHTGASVEWRAVGAASAFGLAAHRPERLERECTRCRYTWDEALAEPDPTAVPVDELRRRAEELRRRVANVREFCKLTTDSCRVQAREVAVDVLAILDGTTLAKADR